MAETVTMTVRPVETPQTPGQQLTGPLAINPNEGQSFDPSALSYEEQLRIAAYADAVVGYGLTADHVSKPDAAQIPGQLDMFVNAAEEAGNRAVADYRAKADREALDESFRTALRDHGAFHAALDGKIAEGAHIADFQWGDATPVPLSELQRARTSEVPQEQPQPIEPPVPYVSAFGLRQEEVVEGPLQERITPLSRFYSGLHAAHLALGEDGYRPVAGVAAAATTIERPHKGNITYITPKNLAAAPTTVPQGSRPHPHKTRTERNNNETPATIIRRDTVGTDETTAELPIIHAAPEGGAPAGTEAAEMERGNDVHVPDWIKASRDGNFDGIHDSPDLDTDVVSRDAAEQVTSAAAAGEPVAEEKGRGGRLRSVVHKIKHPIAAVKTWRDGVRNQPLRALTRLPASEYMPNNDPRGDFDMTLVGHPKEEHFVDRGAYELPRGGLSKRQYRKTMEAYYNGKLEIKPDVAERQQAAGAGYVAFEDKNKMTGARMLDVEGPAPTPTRHEREAAAQQARRQELFNEIRNDDALLESIAETVRGEYPRRAGESAEAYAERIDPIYQLRIGDVYLDATLAQNIADPREIGDRERYLKREARQQRRQRSSSVIGRRASNRTRRTA